MIQNSDLLSQVKAAFHPPEPSQVPPAHCLKLGHTPVCPTVAAPLPVTSPCSLNRHSCQTPTAAKMSPSPLYDDGRVPPLQEPPALPVAPPRCLQTHCCRFLFTGVNGGLFEKAASPPSLQKIREKTGQIKVCWRHKSGFHLN